MHKESCEYCNSPLSTQSLSSYFWNNAPLPFCMCRLRLLIIIWCIVCTDSRVLCKYIWLVLKLFWDLLSREAFMPFIMQHSLAKSQKRSYKKYISEDRTRYACLFKRKYKDHWDNINSTNQEEQCFYLSIFCTAQETRIFYL